MPRRTLRSFIGIIDEAIAETATAYDSYYFNVLQFPHSRDLWVTTSGNPCVFCRNMAALSQLIHVIPGGPFPVANYSILEYTTSQDLTFVEPAHAHDNCQCVRVTVPFP